MIFAINGKLNLLKIEIEYQYLIIEHNVAWSIKIFNLTLKLYIN